MLSGKGRFYCGPASIFKSVDGGATWAQKASSLGPIMDVAMHPTDHNILYLTTMSVDCTTELYYTNLDGNLYRSADAGENWTLRKSDRSGVIWVKRDQPTTIRMIDPREPWPWVPTGGTWRSPDSGLTWTHCPCRKITNWKSDLKAGSRITSASSLLRHRLSETLNFF